MALALSPVPQISISFAPPQEDVAEPSSPFTPTSWPTPIENDGFRNQHLTPPPMVSPHFAARQLSPLRPADAPVKGQGLERSRFEELLRASRERNAAVGAKRAPDLRKEVALKVHKTKQVERRALFLSKVHAPPSPSAAMTPKTPPESPAIFHFTLPSPGIVSPLSLFESLSEDPSRVAPCEPWVEQVDFRLPKTPKVVITEASDSPMRTPLPSLDQITAHLNSHRHPMEPVKPRENNGYRPAGMRLPAFLKSSIVRPQQEVPVATAQTTVPAAAPTKPRAMLSIGGNGRLQLPIRALAPSSNVISAPRPVKPVESLLPPKSPSSPLVPKLQVTTRVVPRTSTTSPVELSENNLLKLDSRARMRKDMLATLSRRTNKPTGVSDHTKHGHDEEDLDLDIRKARRHSAPSELQSVHRSGGPFIHAVLSMPGGF